MQPNDDKIIIADLEVAYRVGVTEAERSAPQRLCLTLELFHDLQRASAADDLAATIDYFAVCQRLLHFGDGVHWALIETVAADIAAMILEEFHPRAVTVEVRKFIIPQTRHVSVRITRGQPGGAGH